MNALNTDPDYTDALEEDDFDDELDEIMSLLSRRPPRSLNYEFAHQQFATLISLETNTIFGMSETELHDVIENHLDQMLEYEVYDETFRPIDVKVQKLAIEDNPAFIVSFPTPRTAPDAFMVCAVKKSESDDFWYFTLERMDDAIGSSRPGRTAFCEWQGSKHVLIESDSIKTATDFVRLVSRRIQPML